MGPEKAFFVGIRDPRGLLIWHQELRKKWSIFRSRLISINISIACKRNIKAICAVHCAGWRFQPPPNIVVSWVRMIINSQLPMLFLLKCWSILWFWFATVWTIRDLTTLKQPEKSCRAYVESQHVALSSHTQCPAEQSGPHQGSHGVNDHQRHQGQLARESELSNVLNSSAWYWWMAGPNCCYPDPLKERRFLDSLSIYRERERDLKLIDSQIWSI